MGEAKEKVKGRAKVQKVYSGNLINKIADLMDEVSDVVQTKENDIVSEGKGQEADNIRKAANMRAAYSLLSGARRLMEDY